MKRNLPILFLSQAVFGSAALLVVTVGGIVGNRFAPEPSWATLPVSLMVLGTAAASLPAAQFMRRVGRAIGFASAAGLGSVAALIGSDAIARESFALFCLAATLIGATLAFAQQFRFAAVESVPAPFAGRAISLILLGSIGGALLGPEIVKASGPPFGSALRVLAALYGCAALLLLFFAAPRDAQASDAERDARPIGVVARQPVFRVAVLGGVIGQGVMAYIMTATPLSMHVMDGHAMEVTADVIRAHVIAMYLPSLVSGWLAERIGTFRLMAIGTVVMAVTLAIGLSGQQVLHYWWALVLLGVGWNFLFVGGTTLLVTTYRPGERFAAQGLNDLGVFGGSALASLLAGTLMHRVGWEPLLLSAAPALLAMFVVLWIYRSR